MSPKLARIIAALAARCVTIRQANGFATELGDAVNDWPIELEHGADHGLSVYLLERSKRTAPGDGAKAASVRQAVDAEILVEAHQKTATYPALARYELGATMLGDIQKAIETAANDGLEKLLTGAFVPECLSEAIDYSDAAGEVVSVRAVYSIPHVRRRADPEIA